MWESHKEYKTHEHLIPGCYQSSNTAIKNNLLNPVWCSLNLVNEKWKKMKLRKHRWTDLWNLIFVIVPNYFPPLCVTILEIATYFAGIYILSSLCTNYVNFFSIQTDTEIIRMSRRTFQNKIALCSGDNDRNDIKIRL